MDKFNKSIIAMLIALSFSSAASYAEVIHNFNTVDSDGEVDKYIVSNGNTLTLETPSTANSFTEGDTGSENLSLSDLLANDLIDDPNNALDKDRLSIGPMNNGITIPDPITGGVATMQTYDSAELVGLGSILDTSTTLPSLHNVGDNQYIDLRIADVQSSGGTLNVNLGDASTGASSSTNHINLVSKQTTLFDVDGSGGEDSIINWEGKNRVTFSSAQADINANKTAYTIDDIPVFSGAISVQTLDGNSTNFNVTDVASLQAYNDWLIDKLQAGQLEPSDYESLFNQAVSLKSETIYYDYTADRTQTDDDLFKPIGDNTVIHATGENATVNINGTLETNYTYGYGSARTDDSKVAVKVDNGAKVEIGADALLGVNNGTALTLADDSTVTNKGVINGNFLLKDNGTVQSASSQGVTVIRVEDSSSLDNQGIINISAAGTHSHQTIGVYINTTDPNVVSTNSGTINIGVKNSSSNRETTGVDVASKQSTFINNGDIYIGREAQMTQGAAAADVEINNSVFTSGIRVSSGASATNNGNITIGSKTQNSAAMNAIAGDATTMINNGTISIQGVGQNGEVPNYNYGMLVTNAGALGQIQNDGTIELAGENAVGIKVISTGSKNAQALATENSHIIINGEADPIYGTRNYGIWVEGQGSGLASASAEGTIELKGRGAIGVHARGNANVVVTEDAIPIFDTGEEQIAFFAYGDKANISILNPTNSFDVSTDKSTVFRVENGADLNETGLKIITSGNSSIGVNGTGVGTEVNLSQAHFNLTGEASIGSIIEGGATGQYEPDSKIELSANQTIGTIVDGNKHNLSGAVTSANVAATKLTSGASVISSSGVTEATGYIVQNNGTLALTGDSDVDFTAGSDNTGVWVRSGILNNEGTIHLNHGTGIKVDGTAARVTRVGQVTVDDGTAGVQLLSGAQLSLSGSTGDVIQTAGTAHGILLDTGALAMLAQNVTLNINGSGNGIENKAETNQISLSDVTVNVTDGAGIRTGVTIDSGSTAQINVSGNGKGFAFQQADGSQTSGDLAIGTGYQINGNGAGSTGIYAYTNAEVVTAASVTINDVAGGSALVAGTASQTTNLGKLISNSQSSSVVDLSNGTGTTFDSVGTIIASSANALAVQGSSGNDNLGFYSGNVRGEIDSGSGAKDTLFMQGTQFEGGISMGATNNHATINYTDLNQVSHITSVSGGENVLTFNGITARGGSFVSDDLAKGTNLSDGWKTFNLFNNTQWTLTDNLKLSGSEVNIDTSSILYAGNNIKPIISGAAPGSVTVNNQGTIDLTNGDTIGDSLTIQGDYHSDPGRLAFGGIVALNTYLNTGGPLTNQTTDRLLIENNASGTTLLTPKLVGDGGATDLNGNHVIESNEGISLVQVGGNSTANAFELANGYVAAGAFSYKLYAFAPGASDASERVVGGATTGNQFWDYRLANAIVCSDDPICSRPGVIPQVPSYVSLMGALTQYNMLNIDDLHKRLGELRTQDFDKTGNVFARYVHSDYTYHTNVHTKRYGFNYDFDTDLLQIGANLFRLDEEDKLFSGGLAWSHGYSTLKPKAEDGYSKSKIKSDTLALYLTWNNKDKFYIDGTLSYDWHRTDVETKAHGTASKIKGNSWVASIETGYPFMLDNGWVLEPQAQLSYQNLKMDNVIDQDGAKLAFNRHHQTIGRLGIRTNKTWVGEDGKLHTPYIRLNYYHGWGGSPTVNISDANNSEFPVTSFTGGKFGQAAQLGLGWTTTFKNNFSLYGEADYQHEVGSSGARGYRFNIGGKWSFK
ncbi:autotransporter outer membrane beta-barrel domain-containing protein [Neisseria sp. Ec49-e6-T10]|uniref:autotransporter outer membrane beta-barrel domain-containing protein n=1 Tax=Neisseria sp. Ec49-e6-T10 TaxID=3140744 RepID=UPI003EBE5073